MNKGTSGLGYSYIKKHGTILPAEEEWTILFW
jgi:hypothetical protein